MVLIIIIVYHAVKLLIENRIFFKINALVKMAIMMMEMLLVNNAMIHGNSKKII